MTGFAANLLDAQGQAANAEQAMHQAAQFARLIAGPSCFSVQLNVTTRRTPANEVQLRRLYSSLPGEWPVDGGKRKPRSAWTEALFVRGEVFVGEGDERLAETFDDHEQMRRQGLRSAINVPLMRGALCYATFNVFGTRSSWQPHEVLGVRLLALATARWIEPVPELFYRFDSHPDRVPS